MKWENAKRLSGIISVCYKLVNRKLTYDHLEKHVYDKMKESLINRKQGTPSPMTLWRIMHMSFIILRSVKYTGSLRGVCSSRSTNFKIAHLGPSTF